MTCIKGRLAFNVGSNFEHQHIKGVGVEDQTWTDRYRVKGRTTTFSGDVCCGPLEVSERREEAFRRYRLDVELAKIVLGKI